MLTVPVLIKLVQLVLTGFEFPQIRKQQQQQQQEGVGGRVVGCDSPVVDLSFPPSHPEVGDGDLRILVVKLLLPHLLLVLVLFLKSKTKTKR